MVAVALWDVGVLGWVELELCERDGSDEFGQSIDSVESDAADREGGSMHTCLYIYLLLIRSI